MTKVLDQEGGDAPIRAAHPGAGVGAHTGPVVHPWDVRQTRKIGREQLRALNKLHETFARHLGESLGFLLRTPCECTLISAEHLSYNEFLASVPAVAYFASCTVTTMQAAALLLMELPISFAIFDLLLGGEGTRPVLERDLTDIEGQIVENTIQMICHELAKAWQPFSLGIRFEQRRSADELARLMPLEEKNLCLGFEVKVSEVRGTMSLALPAVASNAMLRNISANLVHEGQSGTPQTRAQLQQALLRSVFSVELVVSNLRIPSRCLADLAPGTLLLFARSISSQASLEIDGAPICTAFPARLNAQRAAQVEHLDSPRE
jgi:flagellar motor switch protein FliM